MAECTVKIGADSPISCDKVNADMPGSPGWWPLIVDEQSNPFGTEVCEYGSVWEH